jgi:hypothetical protein
MPNQIYDNIVLANKYESILTTKLSLNPYLTIDNSLAESAGMKKKINTRTVTGDVEDLAQGKGNTGDITVSLTNKEYEVTTTQGRFVYYDEEVMTDPMVLDTGLNGLAETMVNDFVEKAVTEWGKATLVQEYEAASGVTFDTVVDAIAKLNLESEEGLFMLIAPSLLAKFRKNLTDDLKYSEAYVRTGYIGSVCGVPVSVSKAIPNGQAVIASKDAVTSFVKKGTESEQERDANIRKNTAYLRKVGVVALTDATKVVLIKEKAASGG